MFVNGTLVVWSFLLFVFSGQTFISAASCNTPPEFCGLLNRKECDPSTPGDYCTGCLDTFISPVMGESNDYGCYLEPTECTASETCNNRGHCRVDGSCLCYSEFYGDNCEKTLVRDGSIDDFGLVGLILFGLVGLPCVTALCFFGCTDGLKDKVNVNTIRQFMAARRANAPQGEQRAPRAEDQQMRGIAAQVQTSVNVSRPNQDQVILAQTNQDQGELNAEQKIAFDHVKELFSAQKTDQVILAALKGHNWNAENATNALFGES